MCSCEEPPFGMSRCWACALILDMCCEPCCSRIPLPWCREYFKLEVKQREEARLRQEAEKNANPIIIVDQPVGESGGLFQRSNSCGKGF